MNENFTYWSDLVDKKLQNKLSEQDNTVFNALISQNTEFIKFYEQQKQIADGIKLAERQRLKNVLKMQLAEEKNTVLLTNKSRFFQIFWLAQYSTAIWFITISIVITLSSVWLYRTWQSQKQKKQLTLQWQKAEELLEEPNKKQEIIITKPSSTHNQHNILPHQKEHATTIIPTPAPQKNKDMPLVQRIEKQTDTDKTETKTIVDNPDKEKKSDKTESKTEGIVLQNIPIADIRAEDDISSDKNKKADIIEKSKPKKKDKKTDIISKEDIAQNSIKEFYLPVYALRIQDEIQNRNFTATPEQIRSGKDMPRATKSTIGPKVFVTQYTDKKVSENNVWYYDFNRDSAGDHLFIYADFDIPSLKLFIDRTPSPVKYYLKTKKGVFVLYANQTQKLAELVTDKNILKNIE